MPNKVIAAPGSNQPCSPANPNGYFDASSTADGLTRACYNGTGAGQFAIRVRLSRHRAGPAAGAGLNSKGQIIFSVAGTGANGSLHVAGRIDLSPKASVRWKP